MYFIRWLGWSVTTFRFRKIISGFVCVSLENGGVTKLISLEND